MDIQNKIVALVAKKKYEKAKELCLKHLKKSPENINYNNLMAVIYCYLGRISEAKHYIDICLKNSAINANILNVAAQIYAVDSLPQAIAFQKKAVALEPSAIYMTNLANFQLKAGKFKEAILTARKAVLAIPSIPQAVSLLAQALLTSGRFQDTVDIIDKYSKGSIHDQIVKAKALVYLNRYEAGKIVANNIIASGNLNDSSISEVSGLLSSLGEFEQRAELLSNYQCKNNANTLINGLNTDSAADFIESASKYYQKSTSEIEQAKFAFSIAKFYKKIDKKEWLNWLNKANAHNRELYPYNEQDILRHFDEASEQISSIDLPCSQSLSKTPIFVFGMPRSGTTLVESILSAHSDCFATGESYGLQQVLNSEYIDDFSSYSRLFKCFEHVDEFSKEKLTAMASSYLKWQRQYSTTSKRLVDKMPYNFIYASLLSKIFPNAKFIHVVRNPVANILSIYEQNWHEMFSYGNDLKTLAKYYKAYQNYMGKACLYNQSIYQLSYESLIATPEQEVKQLLSHCGLDFEEQCLQFHLQKRTVSTASREQVRQGFYSSSLTPWKGLETELSTLINEFI